MFWFCDLFMIKVQLQQLEGMQRSRYEKEVLLIVNKLKVYERGTFSVFNGI